jgi:hypothetical protein
MQSPWADSAEDNTTVQVHIKDRSYYIFQSPSLEYEFSPLWVFLYDCKMVATAQVIASS